MGQDARERREERIGGLSQTREALRAFSPRRARDDHRGNSQRKVGPE